MRRLSISVGFVVLLALAMAACSAGAAYGSTGGGSSSSGGSTITMGGSSFNGTTSITITAGQSVTFDDSSGGTHDLVTGTSGTFSAAKGAPDEFSTKDGLRLSAGDKKTITFANAGTYQITCTIHPSMQATIMVTAAGSGYGY